MLFKQLWCHWITLFPCSTGRGQRLVPGNAEDPVLEAQEDPEEEPLHINGSVPSSC